MRHSLIEPAATATATAWRPLRIAMLGTRGVPATYGGIEHHVEEIGSRLVDRGHAVTVFCRPGYSERRQTYRGMDLHHLPTIGTKHLEALLHTGVATGASLRGFDVTHYHAIGPGVFTVVPRALRTSGVVLTVHGLQHESRSKWGRGASSALRGAAWVSRWAPHEVVTVSKDLTERYRADGRAAEYVPNGARAMERRPPRLITERFGLRGGDYVLGLGRLVPEKGFDVLLDAFERLTADVRLVVAGGLSHSGPYVEELTRRAARDPRILLPGYVFGELHEELLANALAFVTPARAEGLPLTVLESVAMGTPVVASDIPVHVEVLGHDAPGRRVVPTDDAEALAAAISSVIADPAGERAGIEQLRVELADEYSWDAAVDRLEAVYLRAAERASRGRTAR